MRLHILLSLALVSGLSGSGGSARVDDAVLHVVVTTDHGQPVHGLPKEDFYVAVDGVERQVLSASERLHTDCSVVVFVDDVHIMPLAQDGVRWLIHQFVERLDPHASVALVPGVAKVDVEFASDRKSVLSVADAQTFKPPRRTGPGAATLDDAKSLDTLQSIAEQLSTRGAGRKIIIWLLHPLHTSASTTVTALSRRLSSLDVTLYAVNPAMVKAYADTLWLEPNLPSTADIVGPQGVSPGIAAVTHSSSDGCR